MSEQPLDDAPIDLRYYVGFIRTVWFKWYRFIIGVNLLGAVLAILYVQSMAPAYTAAVTLHIAPKDNNVFSFEKMYWGGSDPTFRITQIGIIMSQKLMTQVAERLELHKAGEFDPKNVRVGFIGYLIDKFRSRVFVPTEEMMMAELGPELAAAKLFGLIGIRETDDDGYSNLLDVTVTMVDPELAAETANAIAEAYIDTVFMTEMENALKNQQFLSGRLAVLREQLEEAERRMSDFREAENIVEDSTGQTRVDQELERITARYFESRQKRIELENLISQVRDIQRGGTGVSSVPAIASHELVSRIRTEILELEQTRNELSRRYGKRHNRMIALESELAGARAALLDQISKVLEGIESDLKIARRRERVAEEGMEAARGRVQQLGRKGYKLIELQQDIDVKRAVYTVFLEKLNQDDASGPVRNTNLWVADPATVPREGQKPRWWLALAVSFVFCTGGCFALGVTREALDNTLETEEDVLEKTGAPLLGLLPLVEGDNGEGNRQFREYLDNLHSRFAEAIRSVRTAIALLNVSGHHRKLLITSCHQHEGKTSIALSLSASLGQTSKVVLVDADLRRPSVEVAINTSDHKMLGVADVVAGGVPLDECIYHYEEANIDVLAAGSRSLKPLELLNSPQFTTLVNDLGDRYDYVIIDSPPTLAVSDAYLLSALVDTVLLVVKSQSTTVAHVRSVLARLRELDAPVAGVLLNSVNFAAKYHTYYRDYHQYAGYGADADPVKLNQVD